MLRLVFPTLSICFCRKKFRGGGGARNEDARVFAMPGVVRKKFQNPVVEIATENAEENLWH